MNLLKFCLIKLRWRRARKAASIRHAERASAKNELERILVPWVKRLIEQSDYGMNTRRVHKKIVEIGGWYTRAGYRREVHAILRRYNLTSSPMPVRPRQS